METNDTFIAALLEKERELDKQLDAVRTTIKLFQNGHSHPVAKVTPAVWQPIQAPQQRSNTAIPNTWEDAITWNQKIVFALSKIQAGFVQDIVNEIKRHDSSLDEAVLFKRITQLASAGKKEGLLGAKPIGTRFQYYIK